MQTFPSYPLSKGSGVKTRARVLEKTLGDGYTQAAPDGLNHLSLTFTAVFAVRPVAVINEIHQFLRTRGGHQPFLFTLPDEAEARKWRCKTWTGPTWVSAAYRSLTATFVEDFSL